jgi:hypothetical protein
VAQQGFGRNMFDDFDIDDLLFNEHFSDALDAFVAKCPVARSRVGDGYYVAPGLDDIALRGARSCAAGTIDIFAD